MSATEVFKLDAAQARALSDALTRAGFEFRTLAHARFQARGEGVVVSCYRSGKTVVQGKGAEAFRARFLDGKRALPSKSGKSAERADPSGGDGMPPVADSLGSDEAGKGDTFGGITVCAVAVSAADVDELVATGVADSKTLTDERIRALAPFLRERFRCAERVLAPAEYNRAWKAAGSNVNKLLTRLHAECLEEAHAAAGGEVAVVDRFAASEPVRAALRAKVPGLRVVEVPRAERHAAVAAASVVAREAFLLQMEALREEFACDIPLGSGSPVARALPKFVALHGGAALEGAAKIHFKNLQAFLGRTQG